VPAAAVIPAPIAYIKIVAVKASVVEFRSSDDLRRIFVLQRCVLSSWVFDVHELAIVHVNVTLL
jgi:hypothetical protein